MFLRRGMIRVDPGAQQTDAFQESRNLLLSNRAHRLRRLAAPLRRMPLGADLIDAVHRARLRRIESRGDPTARARTRWLEARPGPDLTWGTALDGRDFVAKADAHGAFGSDRALLEIGPGYGRILRSCLQAGAPFGRYIGLDLSAENVEHLRQAFDDPRAEFVRGDAASADLDVEVDSVLSSLTFKHLYPSFEPALANVARQLSDRGLVLFDLIEGTRRYFEPDGVTYIREYGRREVEEILDRTGLQLLSFDEVVHDRDHRRLLVVAGAPGESASK
jgi:SAM-dependent methyltransferase